jgi:hypothetical protein
MSPTNHPLCLFLHDGLLFLGVFAYRKGVKNPPFPNLKIRIVADIHEGDGGV